MRFALFTLMLLIAVGYPLGAQTARAVNVAIVFDGKSVHNQSWRDAFLDELKALTQGEFVIRAPESTQTDGGGLREASRRH